jgi:hypothetical protein
VRSQVPPRSPWPVSMWADPSSSRWRVRCCCCYCCCCWGCVAQVQKCRVTGKDYLLCDYNRDGDSYRCARRGHAFLHTQTCPDHTFCDICAHAHI